MNSLADCGIQDSVHRNEYCRLVILMDFGQSLVKFETCFLLNIHILRIDYVQHPGVHLDDFNKICEFFRHCFWGMACLALLLPTRDLQNEEEDDYDCTGSIEKIVDIRVLPAGPLILAVSTLDYAVTGSAQNVHTRVSRAGALQTAEWGDKLGPDPPLKTDLHTLVLGEGTLRVAITPEVRMEAEAGERTLEVVGVGARGAAGG